MAINTNFFNPFQANQGFGFTSPTGFGGFRSDCGAAFVGSVAPGMLPVSVSGGYRHVERVRLFDDRIPGPPATGKARFRRPRNSHEFRTCAQFRMPFAETALRSEGSETATTCLISRGHRAPLRALKRRPVTVLAGVDGMQTNTSQMRAPSKDARPRGMPRRLPIRPDMQWVAGCQS